MTTHSQLPSSKWLCCFKTALKLSQWDVRVHLEPQRFETEIEQPWFIPSLWTCSYDQSSARWQPEELSPLLLHWMRLHFLADLHQSARVWLQLVWVRPRLFWGSQVRRVMAAQSQQPTTTYVMYFWKETGKETFIFRPSCHVGSSLFGLLGLVESPVLLFIISPLLEDLGTGWC